MVRRRAAGVADEAGDVDPDQGEVVEVEAPSPDACVCERVGSGCVCWVGLGWVGLCWAVGECRAHTQNNNERNAVRQWQHATEAIELWLDGGITVHVSSACSSSRRVWLSRLGSVPRLDKTSRCPEPRIAAQIRPCAAQRLFGRVAGSQFQAVACPLTLPGDLALMRAPTPWYKTLRHAAYVSACEPHYSRIRPSASELQTMTRSSQRRQSDALPRCIIGP